jgi:hypothetical protein
MKENSRPLSEPSIAGTFILKIALEPSGVRVLILEPRSGREWKFRESSSLWQFLEQAKNQGLK